MNRERAFAGARILIVEDEKHLAQGIAENLEAEGYHTETVHDGASALRKILDIGYDLVILDVMLPELDGFSVCREVRAEGNTTPVLFLTAKSGLGDRVRGLESGGDDYLPKPFHLLELLARVRVILRRWQWYAGGLASETTIQFGDNEFDLRTFQAHCWDGTNQSLTHKEAMILKVLAENPNAVISREDMLEKVWGYEVYPSTRTIDNFILRLRKRFEPDPENPRYFHTVRGVGYRFTPEGIEA